MKALVLIGWVCLAVHVRGATMVAPNGFENIEGDTSSGGLFGAGSNSRTQMIYANSHFSLFPPDGAYITELRFRMDGQYADAFSSNPNLEIHLSTTQANPNQLSGTFAANIGSDETVVLPKSSVSLSSGANPGGPNSFSIVIPLPRSFYYNPSNGHLLMDAWVYSLGTDSRNLDWNTGTGDGVSAVTEPLTGSIGPTISNLGLITQFVFEPVPEPSTVASLIFGFFVVGGVWRRKGPRSEVWKRGCGYYWAGWAWVLSARARRVWKPIGRFCRLGLRLNQETHISLFLALTLIFNSFFVRRPFLQPGQSK
jgi:hypothetical protein